MISSFYNISRTHLKWEMLYSTSELDLNPGKYLRIPPLWNLAKPTNAVDLFNESYSFAVD